MSVEQDVISLRVRVNELEQRLQFIYDHLRVEYVKNPDTANAPIIALIKAGNKIEAIKVYRDIYNVGLAEAKEAVEGMEIKYL